MFIMHGLNCLEARRRQLTLYPGVSTYLVDTAKIKSWVDLGATQWFFLTFDP